MTWSSFAQMLVFMERQKGFDVRDAVVQLHSVVKK